MIPLSTLPTLPNLLRGTMTSGNIREHEKNNFNQIYETLKVRNKSKKVKNKIVSESKGKI